MESMRNCVFGYMGNLLNVSACAVLFLCFVTAVNNVFGFKYTAREILTNNFTPVMLLTGKASNRNTS